jgi:dipicolinate synthase subunit A
MKKPEILIAGGDMRQLYCAAALLRDFEINILGFDRERIPDELELKPADRSGAYSCDFAVLPVPPLNSEGTLFAPCSSSVISAAAVEELLTPNGVIFAGKVDDKLRNALPHRTIYDYLMREEMSLKNAVPTAEGAVQLALEELPVTLNGLKVLIVGMGRIGTALAEILKGFGADITAAVHNSRGTAKARLHGIRAVPTSRLDGSYGLVFNTVPKLIFDDDMLSRFDKSTLFIDLASKPGGIDFEAALAHGIKAIWALGLPGITAPVTSGEIIAETVSTMIAEGSEVLE